MIHRPITCNRNNHASAWTNFLTHLLNSSELQLDYYYFYPLNEEPIPLLACANIQFGKTQLSFSRA